MKKNFTLHHVVPLALDQVRATLTDMRIFGQYHPVMEKVVKHKDENYTVHEFSPLPLGFKIRFQYPAKILLGPLPNRICYKAIAQGMDISLDFQIEYDTRQKQTVVTELVELGGFFLFLWPLARTIEKCHRQLFDNLGKSHQKN